MPTLQHNKLSLRLALHSGVRPPSKRSGREKRSVAIRWVPLMYWGVGLFNDVLLSQGVHRHTASDADHQEGDDCRYCYAS